MSFVHVRLLYVRLPDGFGLVQLANGRWRFVSDLAGIDKEGWDRWSGELSDSMREATLTNPVPANVLFPHRILRTYADRLAKMDVENKQEVA
jgi:hypothetical protein